MPEMVLMNAPVSATKRAAHSQPEVRASWPSCAPRNGICSITKPMATRAAAT
eukprot:CAMPEP_0115317276 /NCGR_PEP_ID=MMETSP0270-20121206/78570_1 /TAXON_ID=71861 /ORGANISM="Scrippsiella trochoidea, Strain CCMP3099" /LENGTH=51 /DNA_ID=CAMNT_0002736739 /DNA_START=390 /DNA_END=542 /DNA_ORIENTATION=+